MSDSAESTQQSPLDEAPIHLTLNPQQRAFVREYLIDNNGMQAAIRAGYRPTNAQSYASQLMGMPHVAAAIAKAQAERQSRVNVTADSVLHETSLLANSNLDHYTIDDFGNVKLAEGAPEGAMAAVSSIKKKIRHDRDGGITYDVEIRLWDKPGSLKLMGRHVGLFPDRVEHTGKGGGPIETVTKIERTIIDGPQGVK